MAKKKLMILGGSIYIVPLIEKAHELGIYVITVDYYPDNIGHHYSDEYHNVSIVDMEGVLILAKKLRIDGITSFVNDVGVVTAAYVAEKLGLNFQCPFDSAVILQDKGKFRAFLEKNSFNVPKSKKYNDIKTPFDDIDYFNWPVIVKPTDSCGSRGVTKVENPMYLMSAIKKAMDDSRNKKFIIEDYILFKGYHSSADCFTVDGNLVFCIYSDQLFDIETSNPYAPVQIIWPTTMETENQKMLTQELQRLMHLLKMKHGIYNIETCVGDDGKPYIMEVSPRGGGLRIAEIQKLAYGVDLIENEVRQAVNMELLPVVSKTPDGVWCESVIYSKEKKRKRFLGYEIEDEIQKYIKYVDLQKKKGEIIEPFSGGNTSFGNVFLHCESRKKMDTIVSNFSNLFRLITEEL